MPFPYTFPFLFDDYTGTFIETILVSDFVSSSSFSSLAESLLLDEDYSKSISSILSDTNILAESVLGKPVKMLSESFSLSEAVSILKGFFETISEQFELDEETTTSMALSVFSELLGLSEEQASTLIRDLFDNIELAQVVSKMALLLTAEQLRIDGDMLRASLTSTILESALIDAVASSKIEADEFVESLIFARTLALLLKIGASEGIGVVDIVELAERIISYLLDTIERSGEVELIDFDKVLDEIDRSTELSELEKELCIDVVEILHTVETVDTDNVVESLVKSLFSKGGSGISVRSVTTEGEAEEGERSKTVENEDKSINVVDSG